MENCGKLIAAETRIYTQYGELYLLEVDVFMGRILVVEFDNTDNSVFEEIMQLLHRSSDFTKLLLENKSSLLVINKGQVVIY